MKTEYKCNGCPFTAQTRYTMKKHTNKIKQCSIFPKNCERYSEIFKDCEQNSETKLEHENIEVNNTKESKATKISEFDKFDEVDVSDNIEADDTVLHNKINNKTCGKCEKTFHNVSNKNRHEKTCKIDAKQIIINNTNITNNDNSDNRTINNITINILVNPYDKPDLAKLQEQIKKCIESTAGTDECFPKVFQMIYFNADAPENHSIKYTNEKSDKVLVHNGLRFEPKLFSAIKDKILDKVETTVNKVSDELGPDINAKLDNYHNMKYNSRSTKISDTEFKHMKMIAHDNNKMVELRENTEMVSNTEDEFPPSSVNITVVETEDGPKKFFSYSGRRD
jgi:hypothetical protein